MALQALCRPRGWLIASPLLLLVLQPAPVLVAEPPPPRYYMVSDLGPGDAFRVRNLQLGYTVGALDEALCGGADGGRFGFFWNGTNGQRKALCPLAGDIASEVYDLELLGYDSIPGVSVGAGGVQRPVLWNEQSDGSFLPSALRLPAGSASGIAWGVEPGGQVVGEVQAGGERRAAYWPIPSFAPTVFPLAGPSAAYAVAGTSTNPYAAGQHQGRFALWRPKLAQDSVSYPLGEEPSVPFSLQVDSSNVAMVAGERGPAGNGSAFFWRSDTGATNLPGLGGGGSAAFDFYASRIVGTSKLAGQPRAVLWEAGTPWDLNRLKLPTCRDGAPSICAPWALETARSTSQAGVIVGSGLFDGERHAFLAQPIEMLTWTVKNCSAPAQPLCVAEPKRTSSELIIEPFELKSNSTATSSVVEPYSAGAEGYWSNDGISTPNAAAAFTSYAVFDPGSVIANLPPGQTTLEVRFHFQVSGTAASSPNTNSLATLNAGVALRPARNAGSYSSASGSIQVLEGSTSRYGLFAGQGAGGGDVELPLVLRPFQGPMEVRIEGSASVSLLASGTLRWARAEASALFCAEDPRSITLPDGTPLADLGIKYTLWPIVRDTEGGSGEGEEEGERRNPCRNPLKELLDDTPVCDGPTSPAPGHSLLVTAPDVIQPAELVQIEALAFPPDGNLTATVVSGNATIERIGNCARMPDGRARCPVSVRAAGTLGPDDTVVVRLSFSYGGCRVEGTATMIASRLQFVNPASGDAPRMIDLDTPAGAKPVEYLRPDPQILAHARYGARVRGLAADGVTPVLLRFRAPGPGTVTFTVADDRGSRDPARAGQLADPLAPRPIAYANPVTVPVQQVETNSWAFAVLTAPLDFVRPGIESDKGRGKDNPRKLPVKVVFTPQGGGSTLTVTRDLDLVRPPVMLIHGVWSKAGNWHWGLEDDGRFFDHSHDYEATAGRPFLVNAKQACRGVDDVLKALRSKQIAVTQADVFGHSMGAILTRIYAGGREYPRKRGESESLTCEYREPSNFRAGTIHKFVMIDSPQLGSPWGQFMLEHYLVRAAAVAIYDDRVDDGVLEDLQRQGPAVQALPAVTLPVHAMLGGGGGEFVEDFLRSPILSPRDLAMLPVLKFLGLLSREFVDDQFSPEPDHDVIVGICSQRAGLPEGSPAAKIVTSDPYHSMHTHNTSSPAHNARAIELLNAPVGSPDFAPDLPAPGGLCTPSAPGAASQGLASLGAEETLEPSSTVVEGGLAITAPAPGTQVTAGAAVTVRVEGAAGFTPERILVGLGSASVEAAAAVFNGPVTVPDGVMGDVRIAALGLDAAGQVAAAAPVVVRVVAPAALTGLAVPDEPLALSAASPSMELRVTGRFADDVERDVTSAAAGTTYTSTDPAVATVDAEGNVTAVTAGRALIEVRNGDAAAMAEVAVVSTPGDSDGDGTVGLSDFLELRACWTGPGEDPAFEASSNACVDTFDADGDADLDRPDYEAFLVRYAGPELDCNANGELDLTDIVDGVSQDADGNAVPDECGS
ncbi:MAG TPA: Ig-like domain-containing protein [Thermoanaerobaculia bacterium]